MRLVVHKTIFNAQYRNLKRKKNLQITDETKNRILLALKPAISRPKAVYKNQKIKEQTERLMNEYPDYKKSSIKHAQPKITLFGEKITKKQL